MRASFRMTQAAFSAWQVGPRMCHNLQTSRLDPNNLRHAHAAAQQQASSLHTQWCSRSTPASAPQSPSRCRHVSSTSTSAAAEDTYMGPPRLLVFGGNGFVGTRVCKEALDTGLGVVSISRSGKPPVQDSWVPQVEWVSADVFNTSSWKRYLKGAVGLVTCLGGFGSNEAMLKICGEANILVFREAAAAGLQRAAFVSVHDYNVPDFFFKGYFQGKRNAEAALAQSFPEGGVAVRPSFVHGTRQVGSVGIPLGAIGVPLDKALSLLPARNLSSLPLVGLAATPPVSVDAVAKALVASATDPSVPPGIMDVWTIKREYEG